jgi:hypothetical protein
MWTDLAIIVGGIFVLTLSRSTAKRKGYVQGYDDGACDHASEAYAAGIGEGITLGASMAYARIFGSEVEVVSPRD